MVEDLDNLSSSQESKRAHEQEEQCLFFVAFSRAKLHLRLYLARKQPNGNNRTASPFLGWIPSTLIDEVQNPEVLPLPADAPRPAAVRISWPHDWNVTDTLLRTFEKCPRRFFYTHVLELGGARKPTAFSRTHQCIYDLIEWLAEARVEGDPDEAAAEEKFQHVWQEKGPTDHAFATEYRQLADRLVSALVRLGAGRVFSRSEPLALDLASGRVMVQPDEMAELPNGTVVLRRVRTGFKRVNEYDRLEYSLYHLAARGRFNSAYQIEAVHLTDESLDPVVVSDQKIENRRAKVGEMLAGIAAGFFPPDVDAVTCPRCPHFFICAATPQGPLTLS
jgi:hypothetical protein